ncbi:hypothetical protein Ciccas_012337 [Cichlidogyrus casuarinus]|uniref:Uncharacterized protein n=1 Tax=Cichlidogyrus casuarinus TaxID=1844966 RepID=A0ABD2PQZ3_9PLAT
MCLWVEATDIAACKIDEFNSERGVGRMPSELKFGARSNEANCFVENEFRVEVNVAKVEYLLNLADGKPGINNVRLHLMLQNINGKDWKTNPPHYFIRENGIDVRYPGHTFSREGDYSKLTAEYWLQGSAENDNKDMKLWWRVIRTLISTIHQ